MPLHMEGGPTVPESTGNGDQRVPNILPSRRSLDLESVHAPQSGAPVAEPRCTLKSVLNSVRQ